MKTISVRVSSSKPISLSKATSVLSTFVGAENGASQAVAVYLRRTLEAFEELSQLHRELKGSKSSRKRKRARETQENPSQLEPTVEDDFGTESPKKNHKKKERDEGSSLEFEETRERKKRKSGEAEERGVENSEERRSKKKRRKSD